jgi:hypothetical protein
MTDIFLHVGGQPTLHFPACAPGQRFSCALPKRMAAHDLPSSAHSPGTLLSPKTMPWQKIVSTAAVGDRIFMQFIPPEHRVTQMAVKVLAKGVENNMEFKTSSCGCDSLPAIGTLSKCTTCDAGVVLTPFAIDFLETALCCGAPPNPTGTVITLPAALVAPLPAGVDAWDAAALDITVQEGHYVAFGWTVTALSSALPAAGCNLAKLSAAYSQVYKTYDFRFPYSY